MRVAVLGATSLVARDLIPRLGKEHDLLLYSRRPAAVRDWLLASALDAASLGYEDYGRSAHEAVINFVGVGDPQRAADLGAGIFPLTEKFDELVLRELRRHPSRRYLFLSSGAAYGENFDTPATDSTPANFPLNSLRPHHFYGLAKFHAECKHRALRDLSIVDIRLFNYISRSQSIDARFLVTDILRAIREKATFVTSREPITRDYLCPSDFAQLVRCLLDSPGENTAVDCYSASPMSKHELLELMEAHFRLSYSFSGSTGVVNATGTKAAYYSTSRKAARFGYAPAFTSAESIVNECGALLAHEQKKVTQ